MRKHIFCLLILIMCLPVATALGQDSLKLFDQSRNDIKITGMKVLGSWAAGNIIAGTAGYYNSGGVNQHFHQMNVIWNIANLGIATAGYFTTKNDRGKQLNSEQSWNEQRKLERTFLINAGLDVAYIGSGLYIRHRGGVKDSDRLRGYGSAVIFQGAFLLLFDGVMYSAERGNRRKFMKFMQRTQFEFTGKKLCMRASF